MDRHVGFKEDADDRDQTEKHDAKERVNFADLNVGRKRKSKYGLHTLASEFKENVVEAYSTYNTVFAGIRAQDGCRIARGEKEAAKKATHAGVYGEIEFTPFVSLMVLALDTKTMKLGQGKVFYDLGSGTGKAVIAGFLCFDFSKCVGIEISPGLHRVSVSAQTRLEIDFGPDMTEEKRNSDLFFKHGDFYDADLSDADVVFIHSTTFEWSDMEKLSRKLDSCRAGTVVITLTHPLRNCSDTYELIDKQYVRVSWGTTAAYIQRRFS